LLVDFSEIKLTHSIACTAILKGSVEEILSLTLKKRKTVVPITPGTDCRYSVSRTTKIGIKTQFSKISGIKTSTSI
jgi:hypothetical protein